MKSLLISAIVGLAVPAFTAQAATYMLDPGHTYPNFTVSHMGFSKMHGRFNESSGKLEMDQVAGIGSVEITVRTASIDTGHDKRDRHLASPDFFNAAEFPTMTYQSTKVTFQGDGAVVDGNVTILGVTKPLRLKVDSIECGVHPFSKKDVCGFNATASLKRSDFGMTYGLPAVGDRIDMEIEVEGIKQ